jgi:hypothetical protein
MKLDCILTATNDNSMYIEFIPLFIKAWKGLVPEADVKIVLVANEIPDEYKSYSEHIIIFKPIENVSTSLTAQYIRLLYPALLPYENGVLITDMDMLPMSRDYYVKNIENFDNSKFIYYRHILFNDRQISMCYNVATPKTWSDIFSIYNLQDIVNELVEINKQISYSGIPGESGWFSDQLKLYECVMKWYMKTGNFVFLKDWETGFNRLSRGNSLYSPEITYVDFHAMRPYSKYKEINDNVIDQAISKYNFDHSREIHHSKNTAL